MTSAGAGSGSASERLRLFGTSEPPAERRLLRAGPLSAVLEDGNLRYVRFGEVEIVRALAFVVRDTVWGTAAPEIDGLVVQEGNSVFRVSYRATCRTADGTLHYAARIEGRTSAISFAAEGVAEADFATNRTGFVALHPLEGVAGAPLTVTHTDGRSTEIRFPDLVAPWQPATDIRGLRHEPAPGLFVAIHFHGEAFEMEDHRNWGDASFKTYVRQLARGFPYALSAGESFAQRIEVKLEGAAPPRPTQSENDAVRIAVGPLGGTMPAIRLALDPEDAREAIERAGELTKLRVQGLNARFDMGRHGETEAALLAEASRALKVPVTLEAVVTGRDPDSELRALARTVAAAGLPVAELFVAPARDLRSRPTGLPSGEASLQALAEAARAAFPGARIGGGSLAYFTELNRNPPPAGLDFVSHAFAANIHAADDGSVMETLETVPHIVRSVRALAGETPYRIGLAAIAMRESPYSAGPVPNLEGRRLAATRTDPRHRALFGAAWALGFAARAAEAGVEALTLAMPTRAFGLLGDLPGEPIAPLYAVVQGLAAGAGSERRVVAKADGARVAAIAHEADGGVALWLANLTSTSLVIVVAGYLPTRLGRLGTSTPDGFAEWQPFSGPRLILEPFAVVCLFGEIDIA